MAQSDELEDLSIMKRIERETIINFNDGENEAGIETFSRGLKTRLRKLGIVPIRIQGEHESYRVPKQWIKVSPPRRVSERQRNAARELMNKHNLRTKSTVEYRGIRKEKVSGMPKGGA